MAVNGATLHRFHAGALVPEIDCPPGTTIPPTGPGGGTCDVCTLFATLMPSLASFVAYGVDGGGDNRGVELTDNNAAQIAWPNLKRVALGVSIPAGAAVWHGFTQRVSPNPGSNAGTPLPAGASWIYGPEWKGSVWIITDTATPNIDVRILEISSP